MLAEKQSCFSRLSRLFSGLAVIFVLFIGGYAAWEYYQNQPTAADIAESPVDGTGQTAVSMDCPTEDELKLGAQESLECAQERITKSTVSKGDTAGKLLGEMLDSNELSDLLEETRKVHPLTKIRAGQPYIITRSADDGNLERFEYEIDGQHKLIVDRVNDGFVARKEVIPYDYQLVMVENSIDSNLFLAVANAGEGPSLAILLADIFAWEVDFVRGIQPGDTFGVLVEKRYREGEFCGYGRILWAQFVNCKKEFEAFRYIDSGGHPVYFNPKGENMKKTLLKAPLAFTRISSGFSYSRKHPIFFDNRPHPGIDYAAPTGTPVKAVGNGTVSKAGWGNGYGNQVIIKHNNGLESMYAHLSGFAKGVRAGTSVRQGQVVGYVGSTGYATGPHLDFRLRQGGKFINPQKAINPRDESIGKKRMAEFEQYIAKIRALKQNGVALGSYNPESFQ